jgi:O-antigen/teichoic acid export membrane protein
VASKTRDAGTGIGEVDRGEAPPNLTGVVVSGLKWTALRHFVAEVTRIGVTLVLARLLTPTDYGVAGMALVVTAFALIFADPALGSALIQRPVIDERDRSTVFWTSAALGVLLTTIGIASAGLVADLFGEPQVKELFIVTSLMFTVVALATVPRSLLARRLAYRALEIREMVSIVIGAVIALAVAVAGFGPWAIVANMVAYSITSTVLNWVLARWRPRFTYSRTSLRNLGGFGAKVFTASLISWGNVNLDKVLVGRVLGAAQLGAYSLAFNVMFMPLTRITRPIQQVLSPAYSRIQHDTRRLQTAWLRSKRISVAITSPVFLGLFVGAPDLVRFAFGSKWDAAIVPLQLLCLGGIAQSLATFNWPVLQATGATGTLLRLNTLTSAVTWMSFVVGLPWGISGVAASFTTATWLLVVPETWITARAVGFDFRASLRAGFESVPFAAAAATAALGVRLVLADMGAATLFRLAAVGIVTVVVYIGLLALARRSLLVEMRAALRRPKPGDDEPSTLDRPTSASPVNVHARGG